MTCQILNFWQDACALFVFKFTGVSGEWNKSKDGKKQERDEKYNVNYLKTFYLIIQKI